MTEPSNQNSGPGKNLDNLFRDAIGKQEFTPSPRVWRSLNWKLLIRELMHFNFTNVPPLALLSATGGLIILASLTYWALRTEAPSEAALIANPSPALNISNPTPAVNKEAAISVPVKPAVKSQPGPVALKPSTPALRENKSLISQDRKPSTDSKSTLLAYNNKPVMTPAVSELSPVTASKEEMNSQITVTDESVHFINPIDFSNFEILPSDDTISFIRSGEVFKYVRETPQASSFFSVNAGIAPELALYHSDGSTTRDYNYWLNAGAGYHFSRFSVRTGIGIGYTYDEGVYKVHYESNDSVSYFREVIGYYTDPANPSNIIYITKNHTIYDSVTHIADDRTRNRYTYIQIPVLLGYTVLETPRFSLGFEAGPALTILINEKKAEPVINIPNGRLILLQDNTPPRLSTNWQLWVKLNIGYQITKNWGVMINPYYKYSLTSPNQSGENGKRTSQAFGLDIGIQYLFGKKVQKK